jgi:transcription initiation factor TFIIB
MKTVEKTVDYIDLCPECGSSSLTTDNLRAEIVCQMCGLVIDENLIDPGPEWRAFDNDQRQKRSRTGAPLTYLIHDKGLSTVIDWKNKDSYGNAITKNRAQLYRLRKWHQRIRVSNNSERNLAIALTLINSVSSRLGLPQNVRETAAVFYRKAVEKHLIRGRSIETVAAASIYAACRQCGVPRTLDEISSVAGKGRKEIGKVYRYISCELGMRQGPTSPVDYVPRFGSVLKLSGKTQAQAIHILERAIENGVTSGRNPASTCAAAIYIASVLSGERRTQREVAEAAAVTEVTIRNRYREMAEILDIEITI